MNIQYIDNVCRAMMIAKDIIIAFLIFFIIFIVQIQLKMV